MAKKIPRGTFQAVAMLTLALGGAIVYLISPWVIGWFRSLAPEPEMFGAMAVLGVSLAALAVTIVWAIALLPLRARSDIAPLGRELAEIRARGGALNALEDERQKLDAWANDDDPRRRARYSFT